MDPACSWNTLLVCTSLPAVLFLFWFFRRNKKTRKPHLNCETILKTLQQAKLFPLSTEQNWFLVDHYCEHRVWQTELTAVHQNDSSPRLSVYGCYSKVRGTAQIILNALTDITKYPEWRVHVDVVTQISSSQIQSTGTATDSKGKNSADNTGIQYDVISVRRREERGVSGIVERWTEVLMYRIKGQPKNKTTYNISRYWNKEDNGCCWLLEMAHQRDEWTFHLIQPVEKWFEIDHCLMTVIHCPGSSEHSLCKQSRVPAQILSAFQQHITFRKLQCVPLTNLSLPDQLPTESDVDREPEESSSDTPSKAKAFFDDVMARLATRNDGKLSESAIVTRFRNLIEEKKEWYEEKRRRAVNRTPFKKKDSDSRRTEVRFHGDDMEADESDWSEREDDARRRQVGTARESTRRRWVKAKTIASPERADERDEVEQTSAATLSQRIRRRLWSDRASKSTCSMAVDQDSLVTNDKQSTYQCKTDTANQDTDNSLEAVYNEKSKISNIDIQLPYEEQAKRSGGWVYCGLEREVVILRKICHDGANIQSFLGKGLIACPPKSVFEALRNPRTRFTYDDMLKKIDTLHEFQNGNKILYWYHEVSQMFKKECRDFCVLQYEQIEGSKYILSLRSVKWPKCVEKDNIHRATLHASGWIIEPAPKENKLYSMVTYITQMELGRSKGNTGYLIEEIAAKQPLSIAFLRQYLVPTSSTPSPLSQRFSRQVISKEKHAAGQNNGDDLTVLAAQYNAPDTYDDDNSKPIIC